MTLNCSFEVSNESNEFITSQSNAPDWQVSLEDTTTVTTNRNVCGEESVGGKKKLNKKTLCHIPRVVINGFCRNKIIYAIHEANF